MHAEIEKLLRLQELDAEAHRLEKEIERYPGLRQALAEDAMRTLKRLEETLARRRDIEIRIREIELEAGRLREELRKFQDQQMRVANQKEYEALTHEIEKTEKKISDADERGLELVAREDQLDSEIAEMEKKRDREATEGKIETERLIEREAEKKRFLASVLEKRAQEAGGIKPALLERYEHLRGRFVSSTLVAVIEGNCGGCYMRVLPRTLQDLGREDGFAECTSCHRILYSP